jgi:tetratricopeptide (TPR) repeat protein
MRKPEGMPMAWKMRTLIAELQRRKVTKVAVGYAAIGLGVIEGSQILTEALQLPDWGWRLITLLVLCGFPLALVLAWAVEVTPQGLVRERGPGEGADVEPHESAPSTSRFLFEVGTLALIGLVAYMLFFRPSEISVDPDLVAVAVFENETGDATLDALGRMAADEITNALLQARLVKVVSTESVLRILRGGLDETTGRAVAGPSRLSTETGAGLIITGSYGMIGDDVRLRAEIVDGATLEVVVVPPAVVVSRDEVIGATSEMSQATVAAIAQLRNARLGDLGRVLSLPRSFLAYELYSAGMDAFLDTDYQRAMREFERSLVEDSMYAPARLYLGVTHRNLGQYDRAEYHLEVVERNLAALTPLMRTFAELQRAWTDGEHDAAYRAVKRGNELAVSGNWAYQLGFEALRTNRPKEALSVLLALDPQGADLRGWSPYWSRVTEAYHVLGEYERELAAAKTAREHFPESTPMLGLELRALAATGRGAAAASEWPATIRQLQAVALSLALADELRTHGSESQADVVVESTLEWLRSLPGYELSTTARRTEIAACLYALRRWSDAQDVLAGLSIDAPESLTVLGMTGVVAARLGDVAGATQTSDRLAALDRPYLLGQGTLWRARISAVLGRDTEAVALLRRANEEGRPYSIAWHRMLDFEGLRGTAAFEAFMEPAG